MFKKIVISLLLSVSLFADIKADTYDVFGVEKIQTCVEDDLTLIPIAKQISTDKNSLRDKSNLINKIVDAINKLKRESNSIDMTKEKFELIEAEISKHTIMYKEKYSEYEMETKIANERIKDYNYKLDKYNKDCTDFKYNEEDLKLVCESYKTSEFYYDLNLCKNIK